MSKYKEQYQKETGQFWRFRPGTRLHDIRVSRAYSYWLEKRLEEAEREKEVLSKAKRGFERVCIKLYSDNYAGDSRYLQGDFYHYLSNEWPDLQMPDLEPTPGTETPGPDSEPRGDKS